MTVQLATDPTLGSDRPFAASQIRNEHCSDQDQDFLQLRERPHLPENPARTVRVVDLFCGCGGLSLGLRQACSDLEVGFEVDWAVDSDENALEVYKSNFDPRHSTSRAIEEILTGDLGNEAVSEAEHQQLETLAGGIDVLLAGPPCQGHSGLNNRTRHDDERNSLYDRVGRFVDLFSPEHVLIENVPTVVVDRNRTIHHTLDHLETLGYFVTSNVIDLSQIGVPQRRKRHVVLASRSWRGSLESLVRVHRLPETRDLRWAIEDLEEVASAKAPTFDRPSTLSPVNQNRVRFLLENGLYDLPNSERPSCHQNEEHSYKSMYGRLSWGEPAQTITTGFGSPGQGRFIHPSKPRTLTPHEAARLQFLPDFFDFSAAPNRSALAKVIGNAVPPKLAWIIGQELLR